MIFSVHKPIVLIVDDEPVNVEILAALLSEDYHVKVAGNGKTALAIAAQQPQPDLILLDVMMPEMDGFTVCRTLKADPVTRDIPVIFITAAAGEVAESQGFQLGAVDYITKPINRNITRLRVKNHLVFQESKRSLIEHGSFLNALIENAPQALWVVSCEGDWLLTNKIALNWLACETKEQAQTVPAFAFIDEPFREEYLQCHRAALAGATSKLEVRITGSDHLSRSLEISLSPLSDSHNQIIASLALASDITRRKQNQALLRLSAKVFEAAQEGIIITDLYGNIEDVNPAFSRITGYARDEVVGRNPSLLKSGRQSDDFYQHLWQVLQERGYWQGEIWNRNKSGDIYPEWLSISQIQDNNGRPSQYVGIFTDISALKQHELQLERIAHYDALTGIPNRILLGDRMKQAIAQSKREQKMLAVCYFDLDGFKPVNDQLGHEAGDRVLIECARRIEYEIREMDTVARLGGDEFVILLQGIDHARECSMTLDRLLAVIAKPVDVIGRFCEVSASIGVTLYPLDDEEPDTLLRHADQAMYAAKQSGKNRYHFFDAEQDDRLRSLTSTLNQIEQGLLANEFVLFYQPKVDLQSNRIIGAEALIRWQHPQQGLLSPQEFLHYIQKTELETKLDQWVIDTALMQLRCWQRQGISLELSINIAANSLQNEHFVDTLKSKLARYPEMAKESLQFEIVETAAMEDFECVRAIMIACQQLGVSFALDDYGTGYSSLTLLRNLPANTIKIDKTFVCDMLDDHDNYAIIQSIIAMAKTFSRKVVAEGVETQQLCKALATMGCDIGQGYGIARPMPADDFLSWYREKSFQ